MRKISVVGIISGLIGAVAIGASASALEVSPTTLGDNVESPHGFDVIRMINDVSNPVSVNYRYSITADDNNPAGVLNLPSTFNLSFTNAVPRANVAVSGDFFDMSDVVFTKVGDYKFYIREAMTSNATSYPSDKTNTYSFYVTVRNALDDEQRPTGDLVANLVLPISNDSTGEKYSRAEFTSNANSTYIDVSSFVSGDMADPGRYFRYKIEFTNANEGDYYNISGQDETVNYHGESFAAPTGVTVGQDNYIYLKHGQTARIGENVNIYQVPIGVSYTISVAEEENYDSYLDGELRLVTDSKTTQAIPGPNAKAATRERFEAQNTTTGKHDYVADSGVVLTGLVSNTWPYMLAVGAGGLGLAVVGYKGRKKAQ